MPLIELNYTPIEEVSIPFNKPYFLKGYCKDMVAVDKWSDIDYLKKNFKNVLINNVEYYKSKKDFETTKVCEIFTKNFDDYLKNMYHKNIYLSDVNLLKYKESIEDSILNDLINPNDYKLGLKDNLESINLYIGVDTKTGMHCHVEDDFLLNQIVGTKRIYIRNDLDKITDLEEYNHSEENFFDLDWEKMDVYYVDLKPGDSFCFPPTCWHAVQSDGYTLGVTKVWKRK